VDLREAGGMQLVTIARIAPPENTDDNLQRY